MHPAVVGAMQRPGIPLHGEAMAALLGALKPRLEALFRTAGPVVLSAGSATGFMEAAIRSAVRERVLVVIGGSHGERFARVADACGKEVTRVMVPPGRTLEPEQLVQFLDGPPVDAIALVHSETSTGALASLESLTRAIRNRSDLLVLVDAATSLGASPLETDAWGLDCVFSCSHKALALPPGLALGAVSNRLLARARQLEHRGYAFDLVLAGEAAAGSQPAQTLPLPLVYALETQLHRIEEEGGIEVRWRRHLAMLNQVEEWCVVHPATRLLAGEGRRSWAVSCLRFADAVNPDAVRQDLRDRGFLVGTGWGPLRDTTLRIGHMGEARPDALAGLLQALGEIPGVS